jgi:heme/copper-type cytochrome/quinol oxidase subunit 2
MMSRKRYSNARHARRRERRGRVVIFILITVVVLGLATYLLVAAFTPPKLAAMVGNVIDIKADMSGFDQKEIHVKVGQPVTVRLTSLDNQHHTDGGGKHQWAVDELGMSIIAPPEGSSYETFTPTKAGSYVFYCDICCGGRANPTMQGTLIVEG